VKHVKKHAAAPAPVVKKPAVHVKQRAVAAPHVKQQTVKAPPAKPKHAPVTTHAPATTHTVAKPKASAPDTQITSTG
jgi:hypothetical protein